MITSRDNARVKRWARLVQEARARREEGRVVVEGPHLVAEALKAGIVPLALLVSESGLQKAEARKLIGSREPVVLDDKVFKALADAQTPQGIAAEIAIPKIEKAGDCVFLEGVQDPSNVGAIVRSAAAFGVGEVVLDRTCADPWSPKALRAGMGGHFRIGIRQGGDLSSELEKFDGVVVCTAARGGQVLGEAVLQDRLGWVFGSEAHGLSRAVQERAKLNVRIPMDAAMESLNVAAAAAICLYEGFRRKEIGL